MKKLLAFCIACVVVLGSSVAYADTTIGTNVLTTGTMTVTPAANSVTSVRFQNAAGTSVFVVDSTNARVGINAGATINTAFEVGGTASISGLALFGGSASVAGDFELTGATSIFGINAGTKTDTTFEVGGTASISGALKLYSAPTITSTATASMIFTSGTTKGTCLVMANTAGTVSYLRIVGTTPTVTTVDCR